MRAAGVVVAARLRTRRLRRDFGGAIGRRSEEVQTALKLTDDQKTKVDEINDELRDDRRELFQGGGGGGDFRACARNGETEQEAAAKLAEVLDAGQQKRLMGIQIQVNGADVLLEPAVAKELNVTEDQKTKLEEVQRRKSQAMMRCSGTKCKISIATSDAQKLQEIRAEADKKLLAVLTSEQQAQFEALKGEPVEIDMSQFAAGSVADAAAAVADATAIVTTTRDNDRRATDVDRDGRNLTPIKTQSVQGNELRRFRDDSASLFIFIAAC